MSEVINRASLKTTAKAQLKGRWGLAVLTCLVFSLLSSIDIFFNIETTTMSYAIYSIVVILLAAVLSVGISKFSLNFTDSNSTPKFTDIFYGFNIFFKSIGLFLLLTLIITVGFILLIIPGIIFTYMFSQSFFILAENPDTSITDCLKLSAQMMKGYKFDLFVLELSFIGWGLVCILTLGIGLLWLTPYMQVTYANFYKQVSKGYLNKTSY